MNAKSTCYGTRSSVVTLQHLVASGSSNRAGLLSTSKSAQHVKRSVTASSAQCINLNQAQQLTTGPRQHGGLIGQPGIRTAAAYTKHWRSKTRPQLDVLWSRVLQTSNAGQLLLTLDTLLMHLRSWRSAAVHVGQHHTQPDWAAAGQQVAAECAKYEQYIHSSRPLARRLQQLKHTLLVQAQQEASNQQEARAAREAQQHDVHQTRTLLHLHQQHQNQQHQEAGRQQSSHTVLSLMQQLQLCSVLRATLQSGTVTDSLDWLLALELPDSNLQQLQQLQAEEKSLVAALDAVLGQSVPVELPGDLDVMLQPSNNSPSLASTTTDSTDTASNGSRNGSHTGSSASALAPAGAEDQSPVVVLLTAGQLRRLLQQCDAAAVRQQLHEGVLQPKLRQASRLLAQLARCRQRQALLSGEDSYFAQTQQRLQLVTSHLEYTSSSSTTTINSGAGEAQAELSGSALDFLAQIAAELQALNEQEVAWIMRQQNVQQQQQQAQQGQQGQQGQQIQQQVGQQPAAAGCPPWDWDYLQHQSLLPWTSALKQHGALLQQHLHLQGVVAGFSSLFQQLLDIKLVPRPAAESETWAPHVLVLDVVQAHQQQQQQQQQVAAATGDAVDVKWQHEHEAAVVPEVLGTVYVDVGGSYGTRMLQYARQDATAAAAAAAAEPVRQPGAVPVVAVGLSGSRLVPQQQQQHQHTGGGLMSDQQQHHQQQDNAVDLVLSVPQLWELAHELGHALHLVLSSRQPACHLAGRFLPPSLLELPPQLMERMMLQPHILAQVCLHHTTIQPMPEHLATALTNYYGCRYNSALAVSARVAVSLAELMYGQWGGDMEDYWRGAWEAVSGLPEQVAAAGSLREVSLLPVMAAHQGSYHCYLIAWSMAAQLYQSVVQPLLQLKDQDISGTLSCHRDAVAGAKASQLKAAFRRIMSVHGGPLSGELLSMASGGGQDVERSVWTPPA